MLSSAISMKKILFFTYDFPYPIRSGGKNRAYHFLKYGSKEFEIHLFSFTRDDFQEIHKDVIQKLGVKSIKTFKRKKVKSFETALSLRKFTSSIFKNLYYDQRVLDEILRTVLSEKIDIVHFESFYTAYFISEAVKQTGAKQIFGTENIEYRLYQDYAKYIAPLVFKPFFFLEAAKIKREENMLLRRADAIIAVTEQEKNYFQNVSNKNCYVVENGVDLDSFMYKPKKRTSSIQILFVGDFSYFPNRDAMHFFYNNVFKNLLSYNAYLNILGKKSERLDFAQNPRVRTVSNIADIRQAYYESDVFIFPVRVGGGTNFKILEAMACGVPTVAFPDRVTGLGVADKENILFARTAEEFEKAVKTIIENEKFAEALSKQARKLVQQKYSWEEIGKKMQSIWNTV